MTEDNYSPEAYDHYLCTQQHTAPWANNTAAHRPDFGHHLINPSLLHAHPDHHSMCLMHDSLYYPHPCHPHPHCQKTTPHPSITFPTACNRSQASTQYTRTNSLMLPENVPTDAAGCLYIIMTTTAPTSQYSSPISSFFFFGSTTYIPPYLSTCAV